MKKLITSLLLLLFLATTFMTDSLPPGWYQQSIPIGNKLITDIQFLDSLNGWVITDWGPAFDTAYVFKTSEGGNNWNFQYRFHGSFTALQMTDYNTGYISGSTGSGKIWKTTDGGVNWTIKNSFGINPVNDLFFVNKDTGWACTTDLFAPGIFKTTNGGTNWQYQLTGVTVKKLFFINRDTGWAGSNDSKLYRTTNSGLNWNLQYTFTSGPTDLYFNKDTGWVTGGVTGILKSTNGGDNWFSQANPGTVVGESKIYFLNSKRGWIGIFSNRMLATIDGVNWGFQVTPAFTNFSVYFPDSLNGWAGTSMLIHTFDGGGPIIYTGIKSSSTFVTSFELKQNYPNPFNPSTTIDFEVKKPSRITLKLYSVDGREVDELLDYERFPAGSYYVDFDADDDLASGVYLYQMTGWTEDKKEIFIDTKKMVLIK